MDMCSGSPSADVLMICNVISTKALLLAKPKERTAPEEKLTYIRYKYTYNEMLTNGTHSPVDEGKVIKYNFTI